MLEHLRKRLCQALASTHQVTLATCGPAEIQASLVACEAQELCLYLLIPTTSDHLFNLESDAEVTAITREWEVRGAAHVVKPCARPANLALMRALEAQWSEVVLLTVKRINLNAIGQQTAETIDVD